MSRSAVVALVAYVRASSDSPSLADQQSAVLDWAEAQCHDVVTTTHDVTGDLDGRTGLAEALGVLRAGRAAGLVVPWLHVLADDVVAQEQLVAEVHRLGGRTHSVFDVGPDTPPAEHADTSRHVVREVLRAAARNEPSIRSLRSRSNGRAGATAGAPAFGFRVEDGELRPASGEQTALDRIAELHTHGVTLRQIVRALEAEGHRPKRAERWHPETIRRILLRLDL